MTLKQTQHYCSTADRRDEIARAARALIAESGFEGLRTRDIAERVGINVATLHYHVPTKAALVELLAQSLRDDFMAQHERHPRDGMNALERLQQEFDDYEEGQRETPELYLVYSELLIRARRDEAVAAIMQKMVDYWHGQIAAILRDGVADGSFRADLDPPTAAGMVIGALTWRKRNASAPAAAFHALTAELVRSLESDAAKAARLARDKT